MGFTYRQYGYEKKRRDGDNAKVFGQSSWEDGVAIYRNKGFEKSTFGENEDFYFCQV